MTKKQEKDAAALADYAYLKALNDAFATPDPAARAAALYLALKAARKN